MEIKIKSLKFDADQKLLDFLDKKVSRLEKFYDPVQSVDVALSLEGDVANKVVQITVNVPSSKVVVRRNAQTFESAANECVDILKEKLTRLKEKALD